MRFNAITAYADTSVPVVYRELALITIVLQPKFGRAHGVSGYTLQGGRGWLNNYIVRNNCSRGAPLFVARIDEESKQHREDDCTHTHSAHRLRKEIFSSAKTDLFSSIFIGNR